MSSVIRSLSRRIIKPLVLSYLSKERRYRYGDITLTIFPGVFHPAFFFSTKFLLEYVSHQNLQGKTFLEPCAGSGLISFYAEKRGAQVTATDLSDKAIQGLQFNKKLLHSGISIIKSDLFTDIPPQQFDFIVINPPYYPKNPNAEDQLAWYCGEHFELFKNFFSRLRPFIHPQSRIIMVLSQDCDTLNIEKIAAANGLDMREVLRRKFIWEWNYIFEIKALA